MPTSHRLWRGLGPLLALTCLALLLGLWPTASRADWILAPAAANGEKPPKEHSQADELTRKIDEMASELFSHLGGDDPDPKMGLLSDGVVVCSFVELKKVTQTSSFGRYLAEQMMGEFQRRGFTVFEMRKSKTIKMQEKTGEFGLSHLAAEIPSPVVARTMITGTYPAVRDHILVNARVIDNKTGALLAAATTVFPRTQATDQLLAESATLTAKKSAKSEQMLYMKKLEL